MRLAPAALALSLTAWIASPAQPECPVSAARCQQNTFAPAGPTFSTHCSDVVMQTSSCAYDVPHGTFASTNDMSDGAEITLRDAFIVNGPAAGTPVAVRLRVRFHGTLGNLSGPYSSHAVISAAASPALPGDPAPSVRTLDAPPNLSGVVTYADSLDLVLPRIAGTSFGLELHALADIGGYGTVVVASFAFVDLPPGASISSCKGYNQDVPVPTVATSWGSLKATYR